MSETLRCPMCGKPNPAERETCQYCEARLKPLILRPEESVPSPQSPSGPDLGDAAAPQTPSTTPEEPSAEDFDWLRRLGDEDAFLEEAEEPEEDLPAWLGELAGEEEAAPAAEAPFPAEGEVEEELPAWLGELAGEEEAAPAAEAPFPAEGEVEEELPAWLGELAGEEEAAPAAEAPFPAEGEVEEELLAWLGELAGEEEAAPAAEAPFPAEGEVEEELPAWLGELAGEEEAAPAAEAPFPAEGEAEEELPAWLGELAGEEEAAPAAEAPFPAEGEAEEELPAWLGELAPGEEAAPVGEAPLPGEGVEAEAGEAEGVLPAWLEAAGAEEDGEAVPAETPSTSVPAFITDELPEDLSLDELPEAGALPDWLAELRPEDLEVLEEPAAAAPPPQAAPTVEAPAEEELAPAELPEWLQALRPVVTAPSAEALAAEAEGELEESGPLAGLRGVLPGAEVMRPKRRSRPPSMLITLSEAQQAQVELWRELLAAEEEPPPLPPMRRSLGRRLWRALVALLLFLAIGLPLATGQWLPPLPEHIPPEAGAVYQTIESLPPGAPVLLGVDYSVAMAGEMEMAAEPVVQHLARRQVRLALISTHPMGPALAERLLDRTPATATWAPGQAYLNLGYLSGGGAALQYLARNPQAAITTSVSGESVWQSPLLEGVQQMGDFALVLVITDDPDIARAWVEQVHPAQQGKPLLMVISAQAEPLVRPYVETHPPQVAGMVTGLPGGMAYARLSGDLPSGIRHWGGFTLGVWMAVVLLAVGGVLGLLRQREERGT